MSEINHVMIGVVSALLVSLPFFILAASYFLSRDDIKKLFTTGKENEAEAFMKGGEFYHMIMASKTHHLNNPKDERNYDPNQPDWEVLPNNHIWKNDVGETKGYADNRWWWTKWTGIYFYGLWPFVIPYLYKQVWVEKAASGALRVRGEGGEKLETIFIKKFPYVIRLAPVQTMGGLQVNLEYVLEVEINNPYKALFGVDSWLEKVTFDANNAARDHLGNKSYEELVSEATKVEDKATEKKEKKEHSLNDSLKEIIGDSFKNVYGVTIVKASIQTIEAPPEDQEATTDIWRAKQRAKAAEEEAKGRRDSAVFDSEAADLAGQGRAKALTAESLVMKDNPQAMRLRELQALENAKANVTIINRDIGITPTVQVADTTTRK